MLGLIKKMFVILSTSIASASDHARFISLSNQKCLNQTTLTNLHPNECNQELRYNQFVVNVDRCRGSCNTLNKLSSRVCVLNETEDLNLHAFNMITGINESRILTKHISCKCECKFYSKKSNSNQKWNKNKCRCECESPKEHHVCEKAYILNPSTCSCENSKYVGNIIDESVVICDEIINTTKTVSTKITSAEAVLTKCTSTYSTFY